MKSAKYLAIIACIIVTLNACKKEAENTSIVGFWTGKIGFNIQEPNTDIAVKFNEDGFSRLYFFNSVTPDTSAAVKFNGTYTLQDTTVTAIYEYTDLAGNAFIRTLNGSFKNLLIKGSWNETYNGGLLNGSGKFFLNKQ